MFNPLLYLYDLYANRPKQAKLKGVLLLLMAGLFDGLVWFHWLVSRSCARCVALLSLLFVRVFVCLFVCAFVCRLFVSLFPMVAVLLELCT